MSQKNKNGFAALLLDLLFVAIGIFLLIIGILAVKGLLKEGASTLIK